jgi:hypothetical protein
MDSKTFWKNFNLGKELAISGTFIYNGLKAFDCMDNFYFVEDIFEFFYNISVGVERLAKISIILIEHKSISDQEEFENKLRTHNHQELLRRISKKYDIRLKNIHNEFIQLLTEFYKTWRYDRYILKEGNDYDKEKIALIAYIEKHLNIKIENNCMFATPNDARIKKFVGKIIGKICSNLYEVIQSEARSQCIYTDEIRTFSKAYKIFICKDYTFKSEDITWKEILIYLLNTKEDSPLLNFIKSIEPLDLDVGLIEEYIECFRTDLKKLEIWDKVETLYSDISNIGKRLEMLDIIGNPNVVFYLDNDEEENEEKFEPESE